MRLPVLGLVCVLLAAAGSCSRPAGEGGGGGELVEMQFAVVDGLLGAERAVPEAGVALRPPAGWTPLDAARRDALLAALPAAPDPDLDLRPLELFADSAGCLLTVSAWRATGDRGWRGTTSARRERLAPAEDRRVEHDEFLLAGAPCLQTLVADGRAVAFKLLLAGGAQLDYVVPAALYGARAESLESSIGSVRSIRVQQPQ